MTPYERDGVLLRDDLVQRRNQVENEEIINSSKEKRVLCPRSELLGPRGGWAANCGCRFG